MILYVSVVLNILLGIILFTPLNEQLHKPLIVSEKPWKSDVIVILACSAYESGLPGLGTMVRLKKGLELYRDGWADKLVCSGGTRFEKVNQSIAEIMKEALIWSGVPANDIFIQDETKNTYNDISHLLIKYRDRFNFNKSMFVTSSYHTFRVKKILGKKNINARIISAEPYQLMPKIWAERMELFREVFREYLTIIYFKVKLWGGTNTP